MLHEQGPVVAVAIHSKGPLVQMEASARLLQPGAARSRTHRHSPQQRLWTLCAHIASPPTPERLAAA